MSLLRSNKIITEIDLTLSQKEKENLEEEIDAEAEKEIMMQYMMPEPTIGELELVNLKIFLTPQPFGKTIYNLDSCTLAIYLLTLITTHSVIKILMIKHYIVYAQRT